MPTSDDQSAPPGTTEKPNGGYRSTAPVQQPVPLSTGFEQKQVVETEKLVSAQPRAVVPHEPGPSDKPFGNARSESVAAQSAAQRTEQHAPDLDGGERTFNPSTNRP